jgi:NAD(P)-dependent dehydrogenase (short-subunit alcohol dehydrogenase family)
MSTLRGRVALVTGAGRGIGRAIVERLAADGAAVALAGRSVDELAAAAGTVTDRGGKALVVPTDVVDADEVAAAVVRTETALGPLDLLVANSGIAGPTAPLWEVDPQEWDDTFAVNVRGVFLTCRAALPAMVRRGSGAVVVVGSMSGKRPLAHRTAYAASKTALVGLVRSLALEAGPHGVRVNLVSPGPVTGPRLDDVLRAQSSTTGRPVEELRAEYESQSPLQRLVDPRDVAAAVAFLAGDGARSITGEDLNVSAGITMH